MDIGEIAARAGVSRSTVSYALSGKRPISASTRDRIEAIMRDVGYVPNAAAQALRRGTTQVLGLAIPPDHGGRLGAAQLGMVGAIAGAAADLDHDVLLVPGGTGRYAGFERLIGQQRVDGVLLVEVQVRDPRLALLKKSRMPFVAIGHTADAAGYDWVDLDYDRMVRQCVQHLHAIGRRRLVLVNRAAPLLESGYGPAVRAQEAFRREVRRLKLRGRVMPCEDSIAASGPYVRQMLADFPDVDGLVTINEEALPTLMPALVAAGRSVPRDVAVCGVAIADVAQTLTPTLTACDLPIADMAMSAVQLLLARVNDVPPPDVPHLLNPPILVRDSTAV